MPVSQKQYIIAVDFERTALTTSVLWTDKDTQRGITCNNNYCFLVGYNKVCLKR